MIGRLTRISLPAALLYALGACAGGGGAVVQAPAPPESLDAGRTIRPSGLQPVFPKNADCPQIASPFGAQTRYDGSRRPRFRFGGYHGGMDLSLPEGTALLALAAGTVVAKGEGGQAEGIYLWLRHSPQDTGLPDWVYAKYQHLASMPELPLGATVRVGQVLGRSGKSGTVGGHYGPSGYPHLHLTTLRSAAGEYRVEGTRVSAPGGYLFDPVAVYHEAQASGAARPSRGDLAVAIPYVGTDGRAWPTGTRVVWPVACRPR